MSAGEERPTGGGMADAIAQEQHRDNGRGIIHQSLVREFSDKDVHDVYDFTGPVLGAGAFATVLLVKDRMSGLEYALKQMNLEGIKDDTETMHALRNEIEGMKMLKHPNIVRLQEVYKPEDEDMLYLVLDRLEGGSVEDLRRQEGHLDESHTANIMMQIVDAIRYCHDLGVAHRDLKLSNCMFEDHSQAPIVKVIDFGLCADLKDGKTSSAFVGTVTYAAPEMVNMRTTHRLQCDMFSVGVMAYALISGCLPFYSEDQGTLQHLIMSSEPSYEEEPWKDVSDECKDFVKKCLLKNPEERLTAEQAQGHPWIEKALLEAKGEPLSRGSVQAMMRFQESNMFQRVGLELMAYSLDPSHLTELEKSFREIDTDGGGTISRDEFKAAILARKRAVMQAAAVAAGDSSEAGSHRSDGRGLTKASSLSKRDVDKFVAQLTRSRHGEDESASSSVSSKTTPADMFSQLDEEGVERIFEAMDVDGQGQVNFNGFIAACLQKRDVDDSAIKAAFRRLDQERKGFISFEDMRLYLGDEFDELKLGDYMRKISSRSDGQVTLEDFKRCMKAHFVKGSIPPTRGKSWRVSAPTAKEPRPESKPSMDGANLEPVAVAVAVAVAVEEEPQPTSATQQPEVGSKPELVPKVVLTPVAEEPESERAPAAEQPKPVPRDEQPKPVPRDEQPKPAPTDEQPVVVDTAEESKPEVVAMVKAEPEVGSE